jgi:hypothetical protein
MKSKAFLCFPTPYKLIQTIPKKYFSRLWRSRVSSRPMQIPPCHTGGTWASRRPSPNTPSKILSASTPSRILAEFSPLGILTESVRCGILAASSEYPSLVAGSRSAGLVQDIISKRAMSAASRRSDRGWLPDFSLPVTQRRPSRPTLPPQNGLRLLRVSFAGRKSLEIKALYLMDNGLVSASAENLIVAAEHLAPH